MKQLLAECSGRLKCVLDPPVVPTVGQFANVFCLQHHLVTSQEDAAALRRFKCSDCGKAFKFKHHLKVRRNKKKVIN